MDRTPQKRKRLSASERVDSTTKPSNPIDSASRRQFLTKVGMATVAAGVLGKAPSALASAGTALVSGPSTSSSKSRVQQALTLRVNNAGIDATLPIPPHTTNGDEQRYTDHSGSYSKPLLQDGICLVNQNA